MYVSLKIDEESKNSSKIVLNFIMWATMSCRRKNLRRHTHKVYKSIFSRKAWGYFWINMCGKTQLNFKEYTIKAISQNWEFSQKKLGYHVKNKNPLYLLMILTSISSKIGKESKSYTKFINFNEFFGAKKSAKAIPPNWCFSQKLLGVFNRMPKTLVFTSVFDVGFFKNRWRE